MIDAQAARELLLSLPAAEECEPFGPDVLVYKVGCKMFATLGIEDEVGRTNLKCDPERARALRAAHPDAILPGYHMNKRHWNTLLLDGTLPDRLVVELIRHSYALVVSSLPKSTRAGIGDA